VTLEIFSWNEWKSWIVWVWLPGTPDHQTIIGTGAWCTLFLLNQIERMPVVSMEMTGYVT